MLNFFMILGWAPAENQEIITLDQYIEQFDPKDISSKSVVFDLDKLDWINGVYVRQLPVSELTERLQPFLPADFPKEHLDIILPLVRERIVKLSDIEELTQFFYREIAPEKELLLKKGDAGIVTEQLNETHAALSALNTWTTESIEQVIRELQEKHDWKRGQYFMMLRIAVTAQTATPPLFETMEVLGKLPVLARLKVATDLIA